MTPAKTSTQFQAGREGRGERAAYCAHCAEPLEGLRVVQREIGATGRSFCSPGCAFIGEQIALARSRLAPGAAAEAGAEVAQAAQRGDTCRIAIRGMVCAACAIRIEARLRATPGVTLADVDFAARRATVAFDRNRITPQALAGVIERSGYRIERGAAGDTERREARWEMLRVAVAWVAMVQVLMLAVPLYLARAGEIGPGLQTWLRVAQALLTVPVVLFAAAPLWRAAASQLRAGQVGMEVAVVLSLGAALAASAVSLAAGSGPVYFDSITMLVALPLSVRWWQQRALARAAAHVEAACATEDGATQRLRDYPHSPDYEEVASSRLTPGDFVIVPAGQRVPADGRVVEGCSTLSQTWLTGESAPREVTTGTRVLAGTLNLEQPLVVEVLRSGDQTSAAALQRLIVEAATQRPRPVELDHRVAARFVPLLLLISAASAAGWALVDASAALPRAIAMLILTCPCAAALAVPLARTMAQVAAARRGILVARPSVLEELNRIDLVAFDKTGTLTETEPVVTGILSMREMDDPECLRIAASLQSRSARPFARALIGTARQARLALTPVSSLTEVSGAGVEGWVDGCLYRLGKPDFALSLAGEAPLSLDIELLALQRPESGTFLVLADQAGPIALIRFGERVRADAPSLVAGLAQQGAELTLMSADPSPAVQAVADALDGHALLATYPEQTPAGKQSLLARWQRQGRRVAMVGTGFNDAAVLAQADASIALGSGADPAPARADVICLRSRLSDVAFVFELARRTARVVRFNFAWALGGTALLVPLAVLGRPSPLIAVVGIVASSAAVVLNSMRLRRASGASAAA